MAPSVRCDAATRLAERAPPAAQWLALRTAILVGLLVPHEVGARERPIRALRLIPDRHMWLDALVIDKPRQHGRGTVRHVPDKPLGLQREVGFDAFDHVLRRLDL